MATAQALGERTYLEGSTWEDGDDRLHTTYSPTGSTRGSSAARG